MDSYQLFLTASKLWDCGDNRGAFRAFHKAAEMGDSSSQHCLGFFFDEGIGVLQDRKMALHWYKRAWRSGAQTSTCCNIARVYADMENPRRAVFWWSRAVEKGDGDAALDLAKFLAARGHGIANQKVSSLLKLAVNSTHVSQSAVDEAMKLLDPLELKVQAR